MALAVIATIRGEFVEAAKLGQESLRTSEEFQNPSNRHLAYYVLARAAILQGEHGAARANAQTAVDIATAIGDRWGLAYPLVELGNVACAQGDFAAARGYYQSGYDLRREFEDQEGMAIALTHLGEVALRERSYDSAEGLYRQAISIYENIHDKGGLAASLSGMAKTAAGREDYEAAREHFGRALQLAADIQHVPQILSLITGAGEMLVRKGDEASGLELLGLALRHPASDHETKAWAHRVLDGFESGPSLDVTTQRGGVGDLAKAMAVLHDALLHDNRPWDWRPSGANGRVRPSGARFVLPRRID